MSLRVTHCRWHPDCPSPPFVRELPLGTDAIFDGAGDVQLRTLILGYLDDHPTAMDTLDGIAEWWVLRQQIEIEVRRVSRVLTALVSDGLLEEHEQGGIRFYRRRAVTFPHVAPAMPNVETRR
jgi:hypothetical protein